MLTPDQILIEKNFCRIKRPIYQHIFSETELADIKDIYFEKSLFAKVIVANFESRLKNKFYYQTLVKRMQYVLHTMNLSRVHSNCKTIPLITPFKNDIVEAKIVSLEGHNQKNTLYLGLTNMVIPEQRKKTSHILTILSDVEYVLECAGVTFGVTQTRACAILSRYVDNKSFYHKRFIKLINDDIEING